MVVIDLAPSGGAAIAGALGTVGAGLGMAKQEAEEMALKKQAMAQAQRKIELAEAQQAGREETARRLIGEREAQYKQQEMQRMGVGTEAGIDQQLGRTVEGAAAAGAGMGKGPLGMAAGAAAGAAAGGQLAQQRKAALDEALSKMSPEMRNRVMAESQRAQQQNAQLDYSRGVLAKIRMADRAEDVLPGYEEVLGPLAKQVERFIQNPELGDQGFKIVQAAEKALDDLLTEQRNDKLRRANADDFEAWGLAQAGANPTHQRIAREMAELNRQGYIKTAGEARGKFLAKIDPEAFGAGQQASAEGRAQERLQSLYTQAARDLTTRGPMGEVMQPTRAEIEERVALMMAPAGGPEEQQQRGTTAGGRRTAVTAGARAAVEPGPGPKEQAAPPARGAPSDPEQAWRFMPPEELGALSDEEFAALEQRAQAVGGPREETRKRVMGTLDPTKKKPKSKKDK